MRKRDSRHSALRADLGVNPYPGVNEIDFSSVGTSLPDDPYFHFLPLCQVQDQFLREKGSLEQRYSAFPLTTIFFHSTAVRPARSQAEARSRYIPGLASWI